MAGSSRRSRRRIAGSKKDTLGLGTVMLLGVALLGTAVFMITGLGLAVSTLWTELDAAERYLDLAWRFIAAGLVCCVVMWVVIWVTEASWILRRRRSTPGAGRRN